MKLYFVILINVKYQYFKFGKTQGNKVIDNNIKNVIVKDQATTLGKKINNYICQISYY